MPGAIVERGDRITLRTAEPEDADFVQRAYTNPEMRYPMGTPVQSRHETEESLREGDGEGRYVVCLDGDGAAPGAVDPGDVEYLGVVTVKDVEYRRPDLTYWIAPEFQGEGYGKEAATLLIDHTFRTYDHPAVGAIVFEFNEASRGLLESLGFEEEGRTLRDRFIDGEYVDTVSYVLFREDWRS